MSRGDTKIFALFHKFYKQLMNIEEIIVKHITRTDHKACLSLKSRSNHLQGESKKIKAAARLQTISKTCSRTDSN